MPRPLEREKPLQRVNVMLDCDALEKAQRKATKAGVAPSIIGSSSAFIRWLIDEYLKSTNELDKEQKLSAIEKIVNISKQVPLTWKSDFHKIEKLKSELENAVKQFLKEQFSEESKITEINFSTDNNYTLIRCCCNNSNKLTGHEFKIYTKTKEIKHYHTNEVSDIEKLYDFLCAGITQL